MREMIAELIAFELIVPPSLDETTVSVSYLLAEYDLPHA